MDLERDFIERADFSAVRRGYDPDEVDRHLREIAAAVQKLKQAHEAERSTPATVAGAAAEQVRTIVEAAETSAAQIEADARADAERVTTKANDAAERELESARIEAARLRSEADADARQTRERAATEAAEHLAAVQEATADLRQRADAVGSTLQGLTDQLRGTIDSIVETVRAGASSIESEVEGMRSGLDALRESTADQVKAATPAFDDGGGVEPPAGVAESDTQARELVGEVGGAEADYEDDVGDEEELDVAAEDVAAEDVPEDVVADEDVVEDLAAAEEAEPAGPGDGSEGARLIALNMALNGTPREETARYLQENFSLEDPDSILDEVYTRVGG